MNAPEPGTFSGDHETLQHEGVLPSQFYGRRKQFNPEAALHLALLESALRDIDNRCPSGAPEERLPERRKRLFVQAWDWFFEPDGESTARISFLTVCDTLEIDPDYFRMKLKSGPIGSTPHKRYDVNHSSRVTIAA